METTKEAEERTFFNSYKSRSLSELGSIIKMLENGNMHLVDLGKKLNHILVFDAPALKKTMKSNDQDTRDSKNRIVSNQQSISNKETEKKEYL